MDTMRITRRRARRRRGRRGRALLPPPRWITRSLARKMSGISRGGRRGTSMRRMRRWKSRRGILRGRGNAIEVVTAAASTTTDNTGISHFALCQSCSGSNCCWVKKEKEWNFPSLPLSLCALCVGGGPGNGKGAYCCGGEKAYVMRNQ